MNFRFNPTKTLQAAAILLNPEKGHRMGRMRLLKLLYVADREALAETGRPITGDQAVALKQGPVLSGTHDLIKGQSAAAEEWGRYIGNDGYHVELVANPGRGKLSKGEVAKLLEVAERYRDLDDWDLPEETHKFPEWAKNYPGGNGAGTIPWGEALIAMGCADMLDEIAEDEANRSNLDDLLEGVRRAGR